MENVSPKFSQKGLGEPRGEQRNGDGGGHRKWSESLEAQRSPKQPCSLPCDPCKTSCPHTEGFPHFIQLFLWDILRGQPWTGRSAHVLALRG